jgi:hypothetical protein
VYSPRFCLRSFEIVGTEGRHDILMMLLDVLIAANVAYLRKRPTRRLYESGVRYLEESHHRDDWQDIPETIARGVGDCEDLACWRIAELRVHDGEHARAYLKRSERPDHVLYHVQVLRLNGSLEDPSRILGMR